MSLRTPVYAQRTLLFCPFFVMHFPKREASENPDSEGATLPVHARSLQEQCGSTARARGAVVLPSSVAIAG